MKKPAAFNPFPVPKRGTPRLLAKKDKASLQKKVSKDYKNTPYVRHGQPTTKSRPERECWSMNLKKIYTSSETLLIRQQIKNGMFEDKKGKVCPYCCSGKLAELKYTEHHSHSFRCNHKGCQRYVHVRDCHPILPWHSNSNKTGFKDQLAVLLCLVAGCTVATTKRLVGDVDHKVIEQIKKNLNLQRKKYVERKEKAIVFGDGHTWRDVEADEACFRKITDPDAPEDECTEWDQWAGLQERGRPESLVLWKTQATKTCKRAPGPGAIKKVDWAPKGTKYLKGRKVILHSDKAKSYMLKIDGVLHDSVRHGKKRVKVNGKWRWKMPVYTKVWYHKLPSGKTLKVKAGTQVIDRTWQFVRKHIHGVSAAPGSVCLTAAIRSAQFAYWNRGKDMWAATGEMLRANRQHK